jgi:hypothetical protein
LLVARRVGLRLRGRSRDGDKDIEEEKVVGEGTKGKGERDSVGIAAHVVFLLC